jgi:hypothetical protein
LIPNINFSEKNNFISWATTLFAFVYKEYEVNVKKRQPWLLKMTSHATLYDQSAGDIANFAKKSIIPFLSQYLHKQCGNTT